MLPVLVKQPWRTWVIYFTWVIYELPQQNKAKPCLYTERHIERHRGLSLGQAGLLPVNTKLSQNVFTRGQFWPSGIVIVCVCVSFRVAVCVCVYQSLACPHDNSSTVQARITKFGSEMRNTLVKMLIIFEGDRPWPSRSNLTWKTNFTSFWACPHDNFSPV